MTLSKTSVIIFLTNILLANSYSGGPPTSICNSMKPGHSGSAQTSPVPFQLAPEEQLIEAGETLNLVLTSTGSEQLKGFIVRAFESGSGNSYGTFEFGSPTSS
jgi:hypothetical protein